ncbi:MAG: SBBP repeat-containing protein [Bacteroidetes bacterium]|nr:SBBP repeat-containing protein [Bacteroidota bacterium]
MKKIIASIIALTAIIQNVNGQTPSFGWAKQFGGSSGYTQGYRVGTDASGNVYSSGLFMPSADFDPGPNVFNLTITGAPPGNFYVSKLNASGNFVWAKRLDDSLFVSSIAVSDAGNVLIMGIFGGTVDFDPGAGVVNRTADYNYQSTFILKLNSSGLFVWVDVFDLTGPGAGSAYVETGAGASIAVDGSENVYLTGSFVESADMDPGAGTFNLAWTNNLDLNDGFLLKLNSSGAFVWAKRFGGLDVDAGHAVDVDAAGNVYVSGMFGTIANFDGTLLDAFFGNYFVYKVKSSGAFVWAKAFGNNQSFTKCIVKLDSKARPCLAGVFKGMADFDPGAATANLTAIGVNPYMSKLDSSGNFLWAKCFQVLQTWIYIQLTQMPAMRFIQAVHLAAL